MSINSKCLPDHTIVTSNDREENKEEDEENNCLEGFKLDKTFISSSEHCNGG